MTAQIVAAGSAGDYSSLVPCSGSASGGLRCRTRWVRRWARTPVHAQEGRDSEVQIADADAATWRQVLVEAAAKVDAIARWSGRHTETEGEIQDRHPDHGRPCILDDHSQGP